MCCLTTFPFRVGKILQSTISTLDTSCTLQRPVTMVTMTACTSGEEVVTYTVAFETLQIKNRSMCCLTTFPFRVGKILQSTISTLDTSCTLQRPVTMVTMTACTSGEEVVDSSWKNQLTYCPASLLAREKFQSPLARPVAPRSVSLNPFNF